MSEPQATERQFNILVFAAEMRGCPIPREPLKKRNFTLSFEPFSTTHRFQEYDGVILFQGIFETFEEKSNYMSSYLSHACDGDELDKRKKEARLLVGQGGFLCFLLTEPFIDQDNGRDFSATDLAKYHLGYRNFYRENFSRRIAHVDPVLDEFKRFLDVFGAASSHFKWYNDSLDCRVLAKVGDRPVGIVINGSDYFLPSLVPDARLEVVAEYFELLADGLTAVHNKRHQTVPSWIAAYEFEEEKLLSIKAETLREQLAEIDQRVSQLDQYKAALFHSGAELVRDVKQILEVALGVFVDSVDELREDIKLMDKSKKPLCVCEIKGINRGIKRENINQTDSHRERSGFDSSFPAVLIANTAIKSARTLAEKDQEVAVEQVKHAVLMRVLVVRTLDLLGLLRLVLSGKLTQTSALNLLLKNVGWLRIQGDDVQVVSGE